MSVSRAIILTITLALCGGFFPRTALSDIAQDRIQFTKAEAALKNNNFALYLKIKNTLKHYALYPYLLYAEHERNIYTLSTDTLKNFLNQYSDSPLSEQLRSRYLQVKAKQEDWRGFLQAYVPSEELAMQCHFLWAELHHQKDKCSVLKQVQSLWLRGGEPPKVCGKLFSAWESSELMTRSLIWTRIKLAIEAGNIKFARTMKKFLKGAEASYLELWIMVHNNPHLVLQKKYFTQNHAAVHEMIVHGVSLIAKDTPDSAIQIWQQLSKQYPFSERHWGLVVRAIGLSFATKKHPDTYKWLSKVPKQVADKSVHEWRIRTLLEKQDWEKILYWTKQLPPELSNHETWTYWRARSLSKLNHRAEAQSILNHLSKSRSFYGFLSSQHLKKPYAISQERYPQNEENQAKIIHKGGVKRARELFLLGRETKAQAEWVFAAQRLNDEERHAAAAIALRWNLPSWSILALAKTKNKNDHSLRFPLVYRQPIFREANKNQIDPALIFAVTRQESSFIPRAKSTAGALGLMQIIPTTAKLVAKKHNMPYKNSKHLFEPEANIRLGTKYLRMLLDSNSNHPALATASYHAGPGRVNRWLPEEELDSAAWIEGIPIWQTREYVQNVLTYAVIYQQLLGRNPKPIVYPSVVSKAKSK